MSPTITMLESKLTQLGLSEKEASIYARLLEMGTSTVSEVTKNTNLNRSTSYVLLEALTQKGLVSISERRASRYYTAVPPERIIYMCEERVKDAQGVLGLAKSILPELKSLHKGVGMKPRTQFFEGENGIKSIYEDTLSSSEAIRAYASIEDMHAVLPGYFPDYYHRRTAKGIHIRAIFPDTPEARERIKHNTEELREAYLVPLDRYAFTPEINIYDSKIVFMSLRERFGLMIESEELSDSFKKAFDLSWEEAKRLHQEKK